MRIAAGELAADGGTIERPERVELVHQHFMLVDAMTVAENLALPSRRAFVTRARLLRDAEETIASSGIALAQPDRRVADLSVGEKAKLELIKAIARKPQVLILDEPTSVLTPSESEELFATMRRLAAGGTAVVFISHKLPEVLAVADRIVVMRRGAIVAESAARGMSAQELAAAMVGLSGAPPPSAVPFVASCEGTAEGGGAPLTIDNLTVHTSETVAIVGVAGNGQSELAMRIRDLALPRAAYIPEDRTRDGLVGEMTIAENVALTGGTDPQRLIDRYSIRANGPRQLARELSGGNQQKLILARELDRNPELILAAEPTRGLDIEATRFVHERLREAAANGAAILLITSDLDEAFALADAIHVIYRGRLSDRLAPAEARTRVADLMAGVA
jgi:simple sugar transport system ATP-binding protein